MKFDKQSIQSRNLRLSLASVEELNDKKYKMKRHGKIEYQANLHRSSNIKYSYIGDSASGKFDTELNSGALHNINGELGMDIILPNGFSFFVIYERNQALRNSHTDKIHLALGYLPNNVDDYSYPMVEYLNATENSTPYIDKKDFKLVFLITSVFLIFNNV